jgi:hypothetical protein
MAFTGFPFAWVWFRDFMLNFTGGKTFRQAKTQKPAKPYGCWALA